jgi:hypothetical protein
VNARAEALLFCDLSKEPSESIPLSVAQRRAEVILMLARDATQCFELGSARLCQAKRVRATVIRPRAALNEALLFQPVKQNNQAAREGAEELCQRSLCHVGLVGQIPQNPCLRRSQTERFQALGKARGGMSAELSKEERGTRAAMFLGHSY